METSLIDDPLYWLLVLAVFYCLFEVYRYQMKVMNLKESLRDEREIMYRTVFGSFNHMSDILFQTEMLVPPEDCKVSQEELIYMTFMEMFPDARNYISYEKTSKK